jgi:hypothetical protein
MQALLEAGKTVPIPIPDIMTIRIRFSTSPIWTPIVLRG